VVKVEGCEDEPESCEDELESCEDELESCEDELESCEAPAKDEGVLVIAKGSRLHKKLRANISMTRYFSRSDAPPLKITG
jgi:hypothetical protein